jgi:hypothetical protein
MEQEPDSFVELIRQNPPWVKDFMDTVPTDYSELNNPRLDAPQDRDFRAITGMVWAVFVFIVIAALIWLI